MPQTTIISDTDELNIGLLWQKDLFSKQFHPLSEVKRARRRFPWRSELADLEPAAVHINPAHTDLIQESELAEFGLALEFDTNVQLNYIWLTGRPKEENGSESTVREV